MPYNPGGIFSLVASYFANPGTTIRTEQHNPVFEDVGAALSQVVLRDGRAPMTGPFNMNGFPINNVATGNTPNSVATLAQGVPIGAITDFAGQSAPVGWALCYGQAISRTSYATLYASLGTAFGAGDGSTTFNLPDLRGRVSAGKTNMGGALAARLTSITMSPDSTILGGSGGGETVVLGLAEIPTNIQSRNPSQPINVGSTANVLAGNILPDAIDYQGGGARSPTFWKNGGVGGVGSSGNNDISVTSTNTGGQAHVNVQPTIILNKIIKVSYDV